MVFLSVDLLKEFYSVFPFSNFLLSFPVRLFFQKGHNSDITQDYIEFNIGRIL